MNSNSKDTILLSIFYFTMSKSGLIFWFIFLIEKLPQRSLWAYFQQTAQMLPKGALGDNIEGECFAPYKPNDWKTNNDKQHSYIYILYTWIIKVKGAPAGPQPRGMRYRAAPRASGRICIEKLEFTLKTI